MAVTIKDIARRTGLSVASVSRALADSPSYPVSAKTRERVRAEAQRMGYVPNVAARLLALGETNMVAVLTSGDYDAYHARLTWHLNELLVERGMTTLTWYSRSADDAEDHAAPGLPLAGAIIASTDPAQARVAEVLVARRRPLVWLTNNSDGPGDRVLFDLEAGGRLAADHLAAQGCQRVIFASDAQTLAEPAESARQQTFTNVAEAAGLTVDTLVVDTGDARAYETFAAALRNGARVADGYYCATDTAATALLWALGEAGLRVPNDAKVIAGQGTPDCWQRYPALTATEAPLAEAAQAAVDYLLARLDDPGRPAQVRSLPLTLAVRHSTAGFGSR